MRDALSMLARSRVAFALALFWLPLNIGSLQSGEIRVMTFNLWQGGDAGKQPLDQSMAVIQAAKADIVGLQEKLGDRRDGVQPDHGAELARKLGWNSAAQSWSTGVITKYPIEKVSESKRGVLVRLDKGKTLWVFNVHLNHSPYQPYQLAKIPYGDGRFITTEAEAVQEAELARGKEAGELVREVTAILKEGGDVMVLGDFNEPSHLDWTLKASSAGIYPLKVEWPATKKMFSAGLIDAYRAARPDEVKNPGWTWTPTTSPIDPKDRHDRIDFIFFGGKNLRALECKVVGEKVGFADVIVFPYPSDHRAVVATIQWK